MKTKPIIARGRGQYDHRITGSPSAIELAACLHAVLGWFYRHGVSSGDAKVTIEFKETGAAEMAKLVLEHAILIEPSVRIPNTYKTIVGGVEIEIVQGKKEKRL